MTGREREMGPVCWILGDLPFLGLSPSPSSFFFFVYNIEISKYDYTNIIHDDLMANIARR